MHPQGPAPAARVFAALAYDEQTHKLLLFGGVIHPYEISDQVLLSDLWEYDPASNRWAELHPSGTSPGPRSGAWLALDPGTGRILLFGGEVRNPDYSAGSSSAASPTTATNELWSYDSHTDEWALLHPGGESLPRTGSFTYDPGLYRFLVLAGKTGSDGEIRFEVWSYDPATNMGARLKPPDPHPLFRSDTAFAYNSQGGGVLVYGRTNKIDLIRGKTQVPVYYQDFWAWSARP